MRTRALLGLLSVLGLGCATSASFSAPSGASPASLVEAAPLGLRIDLAGASPAWLSLVSRAVPRGGVLVRIPSEATGLDDVEVLGVCRPARSYAYVSAAELEDVRGVGAWLTTRAALDVSELRGLGCEQATHLVRRIDVGATANARCPKTRWFAAEGCDRPLALELIPVGRGEEGAKDAVIIPAGAYRTRVESGWRTVNLSAFRLDRTEVSVADYQACVDAGACAALEMANPETPETSARCPDGRGLDTPARCLRWRDAESYCRFVKARLPTEAEWAAAAGQAEFPWGEAFPPPPGAGNFADETARDAAAHWRVIGSWFDGHAGPAPVDAPALGRMPNGLRGLAGNVREWVSDRFGPLKVGSGGTDPQGPRRGRERVVRGASFGEAGPEALRTARRAAYLPDVRSAHIGFRCASSDETAAGRAGGGAGP